MLFDTLDTKSYPKIPQKKQNYANQQDDQESNSLSNEATITWPEVLQETVVETTQLLEEKTTLKLKN